MAVEWKAVARRTGASRKHKREKLSIRYWTAPAMEPLGVYATRKWLKQLSPRAPCQGGRVADLGKGWFTVPYSPLAN